MKIAFDLDGTLVTMENIIKEHMKEYGYLIDSVHDYSFSGFNDEFRINLFNKFSDPNYMCNEKYVKIIEGNDIFIKELSKNNTLYLITARHQDLIEGTKKIIKCYFGDLFEEIHFINSISEYKNKSKLIEELNIDFWVDDNPVDCKEVSDLGVTVFMISNKNTEYNKHIRNLKGINTVERACDINFEDVRI